MPSPNAIKTALGPLLAIDTAPVKGKAAQAAPKALALSKEKEVVVSASLKDKVETCVKTIDRWISSHGLDYLGNYNFFNAFFVLGSFMMHLYKKQTVSVYEYPLDCIVHGIQSDITENSSNAMKTAAVGLNVLRLAQIATNLYLRDSTIPLKFNYLDIVNHSVNLAALTWLATRTKGVKNEDTSNSTSKVAQPVVVPLKTLVVSRPPLQLSLKDDTAGAMLAKAAVLRGPTVPVKLNVNKPVVVPAKGNISASSTVPSFNNPAIDGNKPLPSKDVRMNTDVSAAAKDDKSKVKIAHIKQKLGEQLKSFEGWAQAKNWKIFSPEHSHYDWWMFPVMRPSTGQGTEFAVSTSEIEMLKLDPQFMKNYRRGVELVVKSWGWDLEKDGPVDNTQKTPDQKWTGYDVRLGKMANSLYLFGEAKLYTKLQKFFNTVCKTKDAPRLEDWVVETLTRKIG